MYEGQHVLPRNFQPPALAALGVRPPARPIRSGEVPAYPPLLPTLASFTTTQVGGRGYTRMIPSLPPQAPMGSPLWRPVSQAGTMPPDKGTYAWGNPVTTPRRFGQAGLGAYMRAPSVLPLTSAADLGIRSQPGWGLGQTGYRPVGLGAGVGCPGCAGGLGFTAGPLGELDLKTLVVAAAVFWIGAKLLQTGRRASKSIRRRLTQSSRPNPALRRARRRNVAAGFYDEDGIFHPLRASFYYDPSRVGEKKKRRARKRARRR